MKSINAKELAALFGISDRAVRDLAVAGHVVKSGRGQFDRDGSITTYVTHLREVAARHGGAAAGQELARERARLAREQADGITLKNAITRREYVAAGDVERAWAEILRSTRAAFLALPNRVQGRLPHLTAHDVSEFDLEIRSALTELGNDG